MKQVEAIIRPQRVSTVLEAARELGYRGVTVRSVQGQGIQRGLAQKWRREEYRVDLLPKVAVTMVVPDEEVADLVDMIVKTARTSHIGFTPDYVSPSIHVPPRRPSLRPVGPLRGIIRGDCAHHLAARSARPRHSDRGLMPGPSRYCLLP